MADENAELEAPANEPAAKGPEEQVDEPKTEEIPPEVGIEALKLQLQQEKRAREEAERRERAAVQKAKASHVEVQNSDLQLVSSAIETVKRDNMMARKALSEALAAGDYDKAAEVQDAMSMNNAKLLQLENGRVALEGKVKAATEAPAVEDLDPVEAVASQLSPRSASWVRSHPDYARDRGKYLTMIGAHNMAVGNGLVADTDEYFAYIERQLGLRQQRATQAADDEGDDPTSAAAKPAVRRPQPPAAPPTRGGSNGRGIRLTAEQREAAEISGLTEEQYAANLAAEQKRRTN